MGSFDCVCKGLFLGSLFCPVGLHVCLYASTMPLIAVLYNFFKSGNVTSPFLLFFFRIILVIRGPLRFDRNFRMDFFSVSSKKGHCVF